jgi:DNA ligase-1
MSNFVSIIKRCEAASGAGSKQIIQATLAEADETAKVLITAALDPYQVFGVKQYCPPKFFGTQPIDIAYQNFKMTLIGLARRDFTGDDAREMVTTVLSMFPEEDAPYVARVIDKDLRMGASADSVNKALGEKLIPTFEVMLADKCDSTDDFEKYVTFPCQADFKYDGQRTISFTWLGKDTEYRARSGKPSDHLNGLFDDELHLLRAYLCTKYGKVWEDIVVDGEAFASNFIETINAKKAGNDTAKAALKYRVFFVMPMFDWRNQSTKITMRENRARLAEALREIKSTKLLLSEGREVKDFQDMTAFCNEVIDVHKQEGLILKDWDATYAWDRTFAWAKVKRFHDVDCKIVGFYKGKPKTKNANRLGGIKVWGRTECGTIVESDVGSGFTDEHRDEIWANQDKYLGATVVIKYQEISKSKNKEVASLRFPTFEHFRDDKIVE